MVKSVFSFGSMTLVVGGLALALLLFWGWRSGEALPLWPALLVAAVNVFGAVKLVLEGKARRAALQAAAQTASAPASHRPGDPTKAGSQASR